MQMRNPHALMDRVIAAQDQVIAARVSGERDFIIIGSQAVHAHCLEIHDLLVTKLAAGCLKDLELAGALLQRGLADPKKVRQRIAQLPGAGGRASLRARLATLLQSLDWPGA